MENFRHECGVALVRLLKPIEYYKKKYSSWEYGLNILYLLLEKQHNRGQEGAGIGCINSLSEPGQEYIFRERAVGSSAIQKVFQNVYKTINSIPQNTNYQEIPFCGELYMGHLRYSTTGNSGLLYVHPFLKRSSFRSGSLMLCGNFNFTNVEEVFKHLISLGYHPRFYSDTLMILEIIGSLLDKEVYNLYQNLKEKKKYIYNTTEGICLKKILKHSVENLDGGYVVCGATGDMDMFTLRDPNGIRPAFYYYDEEVVIVASERPVIQTVMHVKHKDVHEIPPGQAVIVKKSGQLSLEQICQTGKILPCSFERIYFSRGSDKDIYQERKMLGRLLVSPILEVIGYDLECTVFSFIPNTAEIAFYGMMEGLEEYLNKQKKDLIQQSVNSLTETDLNKILSMRIRKEKVVFKDIKLRTFITEGKTRDNLTAHIYDVTYHSIRPNQDILVVIDDSIVRGTTLKQSIIGILNRLLPKKIIIASSSPQVRYPDCYGIDMSRMGEFVAFQAAIILLKERDMQFVIEETYQKCKEQLLLPKEQIVNCVKDIYRPFSPEELSHKISCIVTPKDVSTDVIIVYQSLEGLHMSCSKHKGDWYFSGNYPTFGGNKFVDLSFIYYYENNYKQLLTAK